ncbi:MAG: M20 family metallopeptidase [Trueperaceae bacterium]|nr:M20 family metallopeptidase [Trueperaceae bacterium]
MTVHTQHAHPQHVRDEVALAQQLVRLHSPSGAEADAMALLISTFKTLGYDDAYLDDAGNAIGVLRRGDGPTLMFNGHLDTVPLGDEALWPHPPLSGTIADGRLYGRGACDMKSALACMAYAAKDAAEAGFAGTLMVAAVVQEEVGGLGARHLATHTAPDIVVIGEPSKLKLMLGHRGRVEIDVRFPGKIAHAAKNSLGDNALYGAAEFLQRIRDLPLPQGGPLGGSSLTPTLFTSYPRDGANVVPGRADLTIDYRNLPGDEPSDILARLQALAPDAHFEIPTEFARSENGKVSLDFPRVMPPYLAPGENAHVNTARTVIRDTLAELDRRFEEDVWWFGTDAPYLAESGALVIGFGPGEEELAHTTNESIPLEHLAVARRVYAALASAYLGTPA